MPIPGTTRYQPIVDHLAVVTEAVAVLTFAEIEALIDRPLPVSAVVSTAYWTRTNFLHVRAWQQAGWHAHFDRRNQCVHFTRDAEGNP